MKQVIFADIPTGAGFLPSTVSYLPSGKRVQQTMENHNVFLMRKSTISNFNWAIFNSKLLVYQRV